MKPKPLDLEEIRENVRKIFADKEKFRYLGSSIRRRIDHEYGFLHATSLIEEQITSAIQGLMEDMNNKKNTLEKGTKREIDVGIMIGLEEAKLLIKKWFPEAVKDD